MEEYINKAAVVAEIESRIQEGEKVIQKLPSSVIVGLVQAYKNVLSLLDTLEVKEVDLEKEIAAWKYSISKADKSEEAINHYTESIAKYFFELGLKAQKGE